MQNALQLLQIKVTGWPHRMNRASSWNMGARLLNSSFSFSTYLAPDATDWRWLVSPSSPGQSAATHTRLRQPGKLLCSRSAVSAPAGGKPPVSLTVLAARMIGFPGRWIYEVRPEAVPSLKPISDCGVVLGSPLTFPADAAPAVTCKSPATRCKPCDTSAAVMTLQGVAMVGRNCAV